MWLPVMVGNFYYLVEEVPEGATQLPKIDRLAVQMQIRPSC